MNKPFSPSDAKKLLGEIIETGSVLFTRHARMEMAKDNMNDQDVINVLRGGVVEPAELEGGEFRYRVRTSKFYVVVSFESDTETMVVTAWRLR